MAAILGSTLIAVSLSGSIWRQPNRFNPASAAETALYKRGRQLYVAGEYRQASLTFRSAASQAEHDGSPRQAAMNWNNAGGAALARLDFREALPDFLKARQIAEASGLRAAFRITLNNLAGLYLQMGDAEASARVAREALAGADVQDDAATSSRLRYQLAVALVRLHRFDDAAPVYRQAIAEILDRDEFDAAARMMGSFGGDCLDAGRIEEAEGALSEALLLVRLHHLDASANILRGLAKLKFRQGDAHSAAALFDGAIEAPAGLTPRWAIYADRGEFRLNRNDLAGALADFRAARQIAAQMRVDIVPADQDRITLEGGLSRVAAGLVEAGNRLAQQTADSSLLRETFDEAEQDRMWSLRTLVAAPNDWRTRLPDSYWDLLARYQAVERALVANPTAELKKSASSLEMQLQQLEATASDGAHAGPEENQSALAHVRLTLDSDSVLFSFHISESRSWLWAVDRQGVAVYAIPQSESLKATIAEFVCAAKDGDSNAVVLGHKMYQRLFGNVAPTYLAHKRWLLELDGPLFDLPFGALVPAPEQTGFAERKNEPIYLFERTELETIPGALMLEQRTAFGEGTFLGIGDPIYNAADSRYQGSRAKQEIVLPRLPATATELEACARTWNPAKSRVLTGAEAGLTAVRAALNSNPSVIHFATHVITAPGSYSSGLIALGLDRNGAMGLMGPAEIVARPLTPRLVVMNGCHSGQGVALPGTGLMGLTRAWLAAGARSVLATRWDVPDEVGSTMMVAFYRALRAYPDRGPAYALQQAQSWLRKSQGAAGGPAVWAAYFVMGRE
jgi:CHAT domain-containing protein/tetratricopeptide (TPR) repeat protein